MNALGSPTHLIGKILGRCKYFVRRRILCLTFLNINSMNLLTCLTIPLDIFTIFTIDNPEFEKHIPDIYPTELRLNKANTSDKETSFLDLNIKVIGSDVHTSVYDDDFGFPIVNFPWLSGDAKVFTFLSWLDLLSVALAFLIYILNIFKLLPNY